MAYVDELVQKGKVLYLNDERGIITDRMGPWSNQNVYLVWESNDEAVTPDEVEVLFSKGLTKNVYRREDDSLSMRYVYCDVRSFDRAIVCGIMAPSTKAELRPEILEYAKKKGYITDTMTPVKMAAGTKSLIFNADGTYSVLYSWHESILKNIEQGVREEFTKNFFAQHTVQINDDGVLMANLSEDEVFSRDNIDLFRGYDIQLRYLSQEYDKELLLRGLIRRVFISDPYNTLGKREFKELGNLEIPADQCAPLTFNEFGNVQLNCGKVYKEREEYTYKITVPYSEAVRELLVDTEKILQARFGKDVHVIFSGFGEYICVIYKNKSMASWIERELICLDYAMTLLKTETQFNHAQLRYSIIKLLESDRTGQYQKAYRSYIALLKRALPEKFKYMNI